MKKRKLRNGGNKEKENRRQNRKNKNNFEDVKESTKKIKSP